MVLGHGAASHKALQEDGMNKYIIMDLSNQSHCSALAALVYCSRAVLLYVSNSFPLIYAVGL